MVSFETFAKFPTAQALRGCIHRLLKVA